MYVKLARYTMYTTMKMFTTTLQISMVVGNECFNCRPRVCSPAAAAAAAAAAAEVWSTGGRGGGKVGCETSVAWETKTYIACISPTQHHILP